MLQQDTSRPSWESEEVPTDWKLASIIPVYQKGMGEDPGNYRPVSLTSVPGEIMEKIILGGTDRHLKNNTTIRHTGSQSKSPV